MNREQAVTIDQAAEILRVSPSTVVKILDDRELAYHMFGSDRRIVLTDLMDYKRKRDAVRRKGLEELYRISKQNGLYEIDDFPQGD